jgi:plasmid replication initiation protein
MPFNPNAKLTGRELVVKDVSFIQSGYWLDLVELRLVALAIIALRKDEHHAKFNPNEPVILHANLYAQMFGTSKSNAYKVLEDAAKSLRERRIKWVDLYEHTGLKGRKKLAERRNDLSWTTQCSYIKDLALVQIWFSPQIIPFLIHIDNSFAGYEIRNLVKLTSPYELRLYELAVAWKKTGIAVFNKETLRERLGIFDPEQFKTASNFNRMLTKAVKTINNETDLTLTFTPQYEVNVGSKGRFVKSYEMKVKVKKAIEMQDPNAFLDPNTNNKTSPENEEGFYESPEVAEEVEKVAESVAEEEDEDFLSSLGTNNELRFDDAPNVKSLVPEKAPIKQGSAIKGVIPRATGASDMLIARADENGSWDIDFIVANIGKAKFQIIGMDRDAIPEDLLRAMPEFKKYVERMGEKQAMSMAKMAVERRIPLSVLPGQVKASDAMSESGRDIAKHNIETLTSMEKNIVLRNPEFRSRYAPQGQSNPSEIDSYLVGKLEGDLSRIPELKTYLK